MAYKIHFHPIQLPIHSVHDCCSQLLLLVSTETTCDSCTANSYTTPCNRQMKQRNLVMHVCTVSTTYVKRTPSVHSTDHYYDSCKLELKPVLVLTLPILLVLRVKQQLTFSGENHNYQVEVTYTWHLMVGFYLLPVK